MALQSAIAKVGVAKQTAKGTAAAAPVYAHGVADGNVVSVNVDQALDDLTGGTRAGVNVTRTAVTAGAEFSSRVFAGSVGMWLYGALGTDVVTGTGPYTHTMTSGTGDLPYLTTFGLLDGTIHSVQDFKVDEVGISFDGSGPLSLSVSGMGTVLGFPASFTPTTDEGFSVPFRPVGGTFSIDVDGAGGSAATARVMTGEVTITNNLDQIMLATSITPDDNFAGRLEVGCSFEVIPDDLALWRTMVTGTATGTTAAAAPVFGSFSLQFTDGTNTLTLAANKVAFMCDFPAADPAGGYVTLSLEGIAVQPQGGSIITATLVNSVASY